MSVMVSSAGPVTTVRLTGEFDTYAIPDVRAALDELCVVPGGLVVVDLREVTFLDSSGIGTVIGLHRRVERDGARLRVVCEGPILRLVQLMHLDRVLDVVSGLDTDPTGASRPPAGD